MITLIALIVWPALIYQIVEGLKAGASVAGIRNHPYFIRALPVLPCLLGAASAPWVLPAIMLQGDFAHFAGLPWEQYAFAGFGAGAVSGTFWNIINQKLKGADFRLG